MTLDTSLQAQVDAQLLEQGAFSPLELLIDTGRLLYEDYERWRRGEIDSLDDVFMGSPEKIRTQLEAAAKYARKIGLVEEPQEFHTWAAEPGSVERSATGAPGIPGSTPPDASGTTARTRVLRISADAHLQRLIPSRYVRARSVPQMDLFFDNPVVALTNDLVRALSDRDTGEAHRLLDRLYAHAPNHADLGAFDRLLDALGHLNRPIDDARQELEFLLDITPTARRLLGAQSRDMLAPLWRQLADALDGQRFDPAQPTLHRAFALSRAQDWTRVSECVLREPEWWRHAPLCLTLAQSAFYRRRRAEAFTAWCYLCWHHPEQAVDVLDAERQPDSEITLLWQELRECEEDWVDARSGMAEGSGVDGTLTDANHGTGYRSTAVGVHDAGNASAADSFGQTFAATDFPAWLLLREPALAEHLPETLPAGNTPAEECFRLVHRWVRAHRGGRRDDEMCLRKQLQAAHPMLFRYLKARIDGRAAAARSR